MAVYVLDGTGKLLMLCSEKRARLLLVRGHARIHRLTPLVIRRMDRQRLGIAKIHALDGVCVGEVEAVSDWQWPTLTLKATGCGEYPRTRLTAHGFSRQKRHFSLQTGSFNVQTPAGVVQGIHHRHCTLIQRADGYAYAQTPTLDSAQPKQEAARAGAR